MVKLAANLSMMFGDIAFRDRFAAAAAAGFQAVEFLFPYELELSDIAGLVADAGVAVAIFNTPAGNWDAGERGIAAIPGREAEFREGVELALEYADALSCPRLHAMAGKADGADPKSRETLVENLRFAADTAAGRGIDILVEPINSRVDIPGYFYDTSSAAVDILSAASRPNLRLQYDIYHMQIMEGDIARTMERLLPLIGHVQLADNPGRNEPGTGEIAYPWLLERLDALGYDGFVGCEYRPLGETVAGLGWARRFLSA